jgi:hypothetical protein
MKELPRLRFIPFRRKDLLQMCLAEGRLDPQGRERLDSAMQCIESAFLLEFSELRTALKDAYGPLDPDADTRVVEAYRDPGAADSLAALLTQMLERANYDRVTREHVERALQKSSMFKVQLYVDMDDFQEALLYTRGATVRTEEVSRFFGLGREEIEFINFDRVVLYIRFKDEVDTESTLGGCQPGSTMLKLFQNVPAADMEMLFPNTRIGMRLMDKLLIGVPAIVSGGVVLTTKMGATLVLLGSLLGFWLGVSNEPVSLDRGAVIALLAGIGALGGYLYKQFSKYRNRKLKYTQALTENLYFKLLDNNAGVLYRVLDEAEESEVKESLLAYYFLLVADEPLTTAALDQNIEAWLAERWQCRLDFDVDDALGKLRRLSLALEEDGHWTAA